MLTKYFNEFEKKFVKKAKEKKEKSADKPGKKKAGKGKSHAPKCSIDINAFRENLVRVVPSKLKVDSLRPIDISGFSPEGADLIAYREYCMDIVEIMKGYVPHELVYGTYFIEQYLDRKSLENVVKRVSIVKKLNQFSEEADKESAAIIPSFVIIADTEYSILEVKNDLVNYYMSNSVPNECELDILIILNRGILVKNWREKRSYVGLETMEDTMLWFFILMNEYLDAAKEHELDLRNYVKKNTVYTQY